MTPFRYVQAASPAEALKHLVSARRELITLIGPDSAAAMAARAFDRKQAQKIRKPKSEEEEAEALAAELEELAEDVRAFGELLRDPKYRDSPELAEAFFQAMRVRRPKPETADPQGSDRP